MRIDTAGAAADLLSDIFAGAQSEKLAVIHLDEAAQMLALKELDGALAAQIELPVREILSDALRLGTRRLILAHNHPSGDPDPSEADIQASRMLAAAGRAMGIRLIDHLIFAASECRSLRALGLL